MSRPGLTKRKRDDEEKVLISKGMDQGELKRGWWWCSAEKKWIRVWILPHRNKTSQLLVSRSTCLSLRSTKWVETRFHWVLYGPDVEANIHHLLPSTVWPPLEEETPPTDVVSAIRWVKNIKLGRKSSALAFNQLVRYLVPPDLLPAENQSDRLDNMLPLVLAEGGKYHLLPIAVETMYRARRIGSNRSNRSMGSNHSMESNRSMGYNFTSYEEHLPVSGVLEILMSEQVPQYSYAFYQPDDVKLFVEVSVTLIGDLYEEERRVTGFLSAKMMGHVYCADGITRLCVKMVQGIWAAPESGSHWTEGYHWTNDPDAPSEPPSNLRDEQICIRPGTILCLDAGSVWTHDHSIRHQNGLPISLKCQYYDNNNSLATFRIKGMGLGEYNNFVYKALERIYFKRSIARFASLSPLIHALDSIVLSYIHYSD